MTGRGRLVLSEAIRAFCDGKRVAFRRVRCPRPCRTLRIAVERLSGLIERQSLTSFTQVPGRKVGIGEVGLFPFRGLRNPGQGSPRGRMRSGPTRGWKVSTSSHLPGFPLELGNGDCCAFRDVPAFCHLNRAKFLSPGGSVAPTDQRGGLGRCRGRGGEGREIYDTQH